MIVVHNPTEAPVRDYPIKDPKTGEVLLWNINPGETLEFPDHVGKYLLDVYNFLQEVLTEDQIREREEERQKIATNKVFTQVKVVKAKGEITDAAPDEAPPPPNPQTGFTNANMQPKGEEVAKPPQAPNATAPSENGNDRPFVCPGEGCGETFKQEQNLRVHYGLKHVELPTA